MSELNNFTVTAVDLPPRLWTDVPIRGTEFMTHKQGQGGFEIHFRTDDLSKYEAVQNECRRQIGHEKPTANVRPVAKAHWIKAKGSWCTPGGDPVWECSKCGKGRHVYGIEHETYSVDVADSQWVACPNCGADMREGN